MKSVLCILLALGMIFALAACGSSAPKENVADLRQFWLAADAHINKCIAEGKEFKASFDWSPYEI